VNQEIMQETDCSRLVIKSNGPASVQFLKLKCNNFQEAFDYIKGLPYKRNQQRHFPLAVIVEGCGTCSTKHAILKMLAEENSWNQISLFIGFFNMSKYFNKKISNILSTHKLIYFPEAHCYLKINGQILDCTFTNETNSNFEIIHEQEISLLEAGEHKAIFHKMYLENWLKGSPEINYSLDEIWKIRELCIASLAN
jgi:hypothetical protein